jgi:hypothetical protein
MPDVSDEIFEVAFVALARRVDHGDPLQVALRVALNAVATEWNAATSLPDLAANLRQITVDIEGHIEQRARDVAAPFVQKAYDDVIETVAEAQRETRRKSDLADELGRRIRALEKTAARNRTLKGAVSGALAAYRKYISTDDLDQLQVAMTVLQEVASA